MVQYLVAAQAFYNFTLCLRGICSSVEFRDTLCTCKLRAEKCEELTTVNFDLELPGLRSFRTPENFFHLPLSCSLHLSSSQFLLSGQNLKCSCSFVLKSDWYRQTKALEVDNFSRRCYQALSSPCFLRRELGNEATSLLCTLDAAVHYTALCNTTHNTQLSRASTALQVI